MQTISEIMTYNVVAATPQSRLSEVADAMRNYSVGAVPVCEGRRLVGIISEDDIDAGDTAQAADVMEENPVYCFPDQTVEEVLRLMAAHKVKHLPVLDRSMQLEGMVSLRDMAQRVPGFPDDLLKEVEQAFGPQQLLATTHGHRAATSSADGKF